MFAELSAQPGHVLHFWQRLRFSLLLCPFACSLASTADAQTPWRIMPVGDSITAGYTDNPTWSVPFQFGYRSGLYADLTNIGFNFQYVGNSPEPFNGAFGVPTSVVNTPTNPDLTTLNADHHEGYGGVGTSFVLSNIGSWLATDKPDIVLLMIGINDIANGSTAAPTAAEANLNSIVQTIVSTQPSADVIVAQITPYSSYTDAIVQYNNYIRNTLVPTFDSQGDHVSTVNQYVNLLSNPSDLTSINPALYANGINHPTNAVYNQMAQTWLGGIQALGLPSSNPAAPPPVNLVANGSFETPAFGDNTHNIAPAGASWNFTSGVSGAGSGIDHGSPYGAGANSFAADGSQQAFLQSSGNGSVTSISQAVSGFTVGQQYQLSFQSMAITGFTGADPFKVDILDGTTPTHLFSGGNITPIAGAYTTYTDSFTATNSTETLVFSDAGYNFFTSVSFIDNVSITAVPEPGTLVMLVMGATGCLLGVVILRRGSSG